MTRYKKGTTPVSDEAFIKALFSLTCWLIAEKEGRSAEYGRLTEKGDEAEASRVWGRYRACAEAMEFFHEALGRNAYKDFEKMREGDL